MANPTHGTRLTILAGVAILVGAGGVAASARGTEAPVAVSPHDPSIVYYGTQVMYHMQGSYWQEWNTALRDMVVDTQVKDGPMAGTWNPIDNWEKRGGRLYSTSMKLLLLEIYYRHLPLYEQLDD